MLLQVVEDTVLEEYEQFDDYLEMVVQFGVSNCFYNFLSKINIEIHIKSLL